MIGRNFLEMAEKIKNLLSKVGTPPLTKKRYFEETP